MFLCIFFSDQGWCLFGYQFFVEFEVNMLGLVSFPTSGWDPQETCRCLHDGISCIFTPRWWFFGVQRTCPWWSLDQHIELQTVSFLQWTQDPSWCSSSPCYLWWRSYFHRWSFCFTWFWMWEMLWKKFYLMESNCPQSVFVETFDPSELEIRWFLFWQHVSLQLFGWQLHQSFGQFGVPEHGMRKPVHWQGS